VFGTACFMLLFYYKVQVHMVECENNSNLHAWPVWVRQDVLWRPKTLQACSTGNRFLTLDGEWTLTEVFHIFEAGNVEDKNSRCLWEVVSICKTLISSGRTLICPMSKWQEANNPRRIFMVTGPWRYGVLPGAPLFLLPLVSTEKSLVWKPF